MANINVVGTPLLDMVRGLVGEYRGVQHGRVRLRPVGGGREWTVSPERVRPATDAEVLSARVARTNARSTGAVQ